MVQIKQRQRNLFKLLSQMKDYKPTSFFSVNFRVSDKTIYNDVNTLNDQMSTYDLYIDKQPRHGLKLVGLGKNIVRFEEELQLMSSDHQENHYPTHRRIQLIKWLLIDDEKCSLEDLETRFFISQAALRKDIDYLQNIFGDYKITCTTSKSILKVKGSEIYIQRAIKDFVQNISKIDDSYDTLTSFDPVLNIMNQLFGEELVNIVKEAVTTYIISTNALSDYYVRSITLTILIMVARTKNNHHIQLNDVVIDDLSYLEPYMIVIEMQEYFEKKYGLTLLESDTKYLSQQMYAHRIEPQAREKYLKDQYVDVVNRMMKMMSRCLQTDLNNDERLRDSLLFHLPPMLYRLKRGIKVSNPLLQEIKKQYIVLFSLTWFVASELEKEFDVHFDDDEISFLFIYFQISLEKRHGIQFKNIVIVCPIGLATSELIFTRIRQNVQPQDNILTMNVEELLKTELKNIDLIISTVKLPDINVPVVYVSPLLTEHDLNLINEIYSSVKKERELKNISPFHQIELAHFFHPDFIFHNKKFKTKNECLDYLIKIYQKRKYVNEEFAESIYEREKMGDTSMYTGAAIPHASPETVLKSQISVVTLKDKIKWGSQDVNLIVFIAVAKDDMDRIKNVLSKLLDILESTQTIEKMVHASNKEILVEILEESLNGR
ncbi:Transcriptional antiterminator [Anaerorhabdus furcosa]|uniref:Transcriptional antiterminator n=2 Tax=Anaerorhabdus furcosa TaxID=118967 RepID=A0A1T4P0Z1_9FIRM|nr:Transcriptional antiterminator [Anaerorhabdus furcosa]